MPRTSCRESGERSAIILLSRQLIQNQEVHGRIEPKEIYANLKDIYIEKWSPTRYLRDYGVTMPNGPAM
jgi:hypothetical protein